jgi:Tol biopolymer transport system component
MLIAGLAVAMTSGAESAGDRLHKGIYQEETVGDLDAAMKIYQEIVADEKANRPHAAQAKYRLGMCYLKKGENGKAVEAFEGLINDFPGQAKLLEQARGQLATLGHVTYTPARSSLVWTYPVLSEVMNVSPDAKYVAYRDQRTGDLALRDLITGENRRLTTSHPSGGRYTTEAIFSPDGQWLAYNWWNPRDARYVLRVIRTDGSESRVVFDDARLSEVVPRGWSPDGTRILARLLLAEEKVTEIAWVSVADGSTSVVKTFDWPTPDFQRVFLSPDGRFLAYDVCPNVVSGPEDIVVMRIDGGEEVKVVEHPADDDVLGWSPDGQTLVFRSNRGGNGTDAWVIQVNDGKPQGLPQRVKKDIGERSAIAHNGCFTRDGSFYYVTGKSSAPEWDGDVYIATLDPETGRVVSDPKRVSEQFAGQTAGAGWSPDGKQLAYSAKFTPGPAGVLPELIVVRDMETGREREFPVKPELRVLSWVTKIWSKDGRSVMFRGGEVEPIQLGIWRLDVAGGEITPVVASRGEDVGALGLSHDGKSLYFLRKHFDMKTRRYTDGQIRVMNLETGQEKVLLDQMTGGGQGSLSPDGQFLAFKDTAIPNQRAVMIMPSSGGELREVFRAEERGTMGNPVCWTPDGRHLLFNKWNLRSAKNELWRYPVEGGDPQKVGIEFDRVGELRFHPDGRQIAITGWKLRQGPGQELWVLKDFLPDLGSTPMQLPNPPTGNYFVSRSEDDAEERLNGGIMLISHDLDLPHIEGPYVVVGMHFAGLRVPRGAQIKKAYLQFTAQGSAESGPTGERDPINLTIRAERAASGEVFAETDHNISSRKVTKASVKWSPEPWIVIGERTKKQQTPNLSSLIQEVVAQPDWREGNALVLIITGTGPGHRCAIAFDSGGRQYGPMLHVETD